MPALGDVITPLFFQLGSAVMLEVCESKRVSFRESVQCLEQRLTRSPGA